MDSIYHYTSLGRPIDPAYVTNRAIVILSIAAGVITALAHLLNGAELIVVGRGAFFAVAATFFAWMMTRELDPDHQATAFVAAGMALGASWFMGGSNLIVMYAVLLLLRMVNRTVGPPLHSPDTLILFAGMMIVTLLGYWPVTVIGALAFFIDTRLENPKSSHLLAAVAALLVGVMGAVLGQQGVSPSSEVLILLVIISVIYAIVVITLRDVTSPTDFNDGQYRYLNIRRVQWAMGIGLLAGWAALWHGDAGFVAMAPLWWSLLSTGLYGLVLLVFPQKAAHPEPLQHEMVTEI